MKEFLVYTALRILLFAASLGLVLGVWLLLADKAPLIWVFVIALVISGIGSYYLLHGPRARFAAVVEERARRASDRFEEMKSREDVDD